MIVFEEPDVSTPNFVPCASCGKPKVLKVGDYCTTCALDSDLVASKYEYIIVSRATLDVAAEKSGITREFLVAKMARAFENFQIYVIYKWGEEWKDLLISETFYIPNVMKNIFEKLEG